MTKSGPERKTHMTMKRRVLEDMRECGVEMSTAQVCAHFPDIAPALIKNALASLRSSGLIGFVGLPRQSLWRASPDDATPFAGTHKRIAVSPEAEAAFAELIGPHRYEDFPARAEGRLTVASSGGLFSATGCAALMCLT